MSETSPLGIIAGAGSFPLALARAATAQGRPVFALLLKGIAGTELEAYPHVWIGIGQFGAMVGQARKAGCRDLVLIGSLVRPNLWTTMPDLGGLRVLPDLLRLYRGGDDHLLRGIAGIFEREGFRLVGAQDVAPELLIPEGPLGSLHPSEGDSEDIALARDAIAALGPYDVGQGMVIGGRRIVAVEGAEGTDGMLDRCATMQAAGRLKWPRGSGVLVKAPKPHQDRRVDMPAIGPATVEKAAAAGLKGIAVVAGSTLVVDLQEVIRLADRHGLFVVGVTADGTR
ncbi:MAG: UDP-2,3-diacylglucosamine diphosphatase LpxI [Phreatobacter sp.]|uniref:LpxI family protein n=1 Tax=Phreatobacter sp. TaxID=1966341 RepID=UPI002732450B|nr:UDP-2,3-diacylglucosamine diphosphatase LpxI [Phreatobacter sp.]MDP2801095.1 UDP-2,3-diacylglucosamine diphosphatase LpxI [Phreatobacter sp.]